MNRHDERLDPSQTKVALILNEKAGRKDARDQVAGIRERLQPAVRELRIIPVGRGADFAAAARDAVAQGAGLVAALGGDGTQAAVAGALAGAPAAMAVLPGGTFNYFAREIGVERLDLALDALLGGRLRRRDLGRVNDHIFINNASFGLYPEILRRREAIYSRWGRSRIAAYWSVLVAMRDLREPMHLTVTVGGERRDFHTPLAFVARSAYQLESLGLDGAKAVREGHFALFLATGKSRMALISAAMRLALGASARGTDFELVISDELLIESRIRRKLVALDGEKEKMTAPFRLEVLRDALRVIVPAEPPADDLSIGGTSGA